MAFGIYLRHGFSQTDGSVVYATGLGRGYGIYAVRYNLYETSTLYLMPGDGISVVSDSTILLKGTLRPGVDLASGYNGLLLGHGVTIGSSAKLAPYLVKSLELTKGNKRSVTFLRDETGTLGGTNVFTNPAPTITLAYTTDVINNNKDYVLEITRTRNISDVVTGKARELALWMEDNRDEMLRDADNNAEYRRLLDIYAEGDTSDSISDVENLFGGGGGSNIVPNTAAKRLNAINENLFDVASSTLSNRVSVYSGQAELMPLSSNIKDGFWVTPLGTVINFYPDKSLGRAFYYGAGLNIGIAKFLKNNSSYGLGVTYLDGYYDDGNADFGQFDTSILNASLGYRTNPGTGKLWLESMLSYAHNTADAYGTFDKTKSNAYRGNLKAGVDLGAGSWRFTPALGVDYTYYDFGKQLIEADLVTMSVKDTDSLRPMAEVEAVYHDRNATAFGLKVGYSYEVLGNGVEQVMDLSGVNTLVKTDRSPRHNGHLGLSVNHAISDVLSFNGEYDLRLNDIMTVNSFKLNFKWLY